MLVLARQCGQSIMVGDQVKVAVVGIHGNQVELKIRAPKHLPIHRRITYDSTTEWKNGGLAESTCVNEAIDIRIDHDKGANCTIALYRQRGESLMIGNETEVVVVNVGRGNVRLGIAAPKHVSVHRQEIYDVMTDCLG